MPPLISVGIPSYNRSALLAQAIDSVLNQSFQDFEIIVSDDASTDDTAAVVQRIGDRRIRYHRNPANLRPPRNWNVCVRLARGEYFALLPDDDLYFPEFLAEMVAALQARPEVAFAQSGFHRVDEQLRPLDVLPTDAVPMTLQGEAAVVWQAERLWCLPVSLLFRRRMMLDMGLWREDYWDDWAFILRLAYRHGFSLVPRPLACNRVHSQNLNRALQRERRDTVLDIINQLSDVFAEALPATPGLIRLRAKFDRQLSQHCILLALGALRRREWATARFHFARARQLYALAGIDPGVFKLWLSIQAQGKRERRLRRAAGLKAPVIETKGTA